MIPLSQAMTWLGLSMKEGIRIGIPLSSNESFSEERKSKQANGKEERGNDERWVIMKNEVV